MKKISFSLFLITLLILSGCNSDSKISPDANNAGEFMSEGQASMFMPFPKSRTHMTVEKPEYLTKFLFFWDIGDQVSFIYTQDSKTRVIAYDYIYLTKYNYKQAVTAIDPNNKLLCRYSCFFPGVIGDPSLAGKEALLVRSKSYDVQLFHGVKPVITKSDVNGDEAYVPLEPTEYVTYTSADFPVLDKQIPIAIPLRGKATMPNGGQPKVITDHMGSLQVIQIENTSVNTIESATVNFGATDADLWYYLKGTTFDPMTDIITPGTGANIKPATISNLAANDKIYFINWVPTKRSDNKLTPIIRESTTFSIPNGVGRKATSLEFHQTAPKVMSASATMSEWDGISKTVKPGMVYWYKLTWDGKTLILTDIEVIPWDPITFDVNLDPTTDGI